MKRIICMVLVFALIAAPSALAEGHRELAEQPGSNCFPAGEGRMIRVRYRINQKPQDKISEIGLGSAYMPQTPLKEAIPALRQAYEGGINYYDLAAVTEKPFP